MIRKFGEQLDNMGSDSNGHDRTIYDVGWGTLIGRNFVAGMSRALGGLFFNIIVIVILGSFLATYAWPQIQASYESIIKASEIINQVGEPFSSTGNEGILPLFGEKVRFEIQDLGKPGSEVKSIEISPDQLEQILLQNEDQGLKTN